MKKLKMGKYLSFMMCIALLSGLLQINMYGRDIGMLFPAMERSSQGNRYGYINEKGKWIVKPEYERTYPFSDEVGSVVKDNLYGLVNKQGKQILAPTYQSISLFEDGKAVVVAEQGMGIIDTKGKMLTKSFYTYVDNYQDGAAIIGVGQKDGTMLYGYLNEKSEEMIPPIYKVANAFQDEKALVQGMDEKYHFIDKTGKVLETVDVPIVYGYSDNRIVFGTSIGGLLGYIDDKGQVVIAPMYQSASPFKEHVAIVNTSTDYKEEEMGLIDEEGTYIYPNTYNDILYLGEERVALGKAISTEEPYIGSMYAIGDIKGNRLTDFIYYGVSAYEGGMASAYDDTNTYFIDLQGNKVSNLPTVAGTGTLVKEDNVIAANVDYETSYFRPEGKVIYETNSLIKLGKDYSIQIQKEKPNRNYLAYIPQIQGMKKREAQKKMNEQLNAWSQSELIHAKEVADSTYYSDFEVTYYKENLLVLKILSSTYPFGAAHPMPTIKTPVINLATGEIYKLEDLFNTQKDWKGELNTLLQEMAKKEPISDTLFSDTNVEIGENQPFYVDNEALYIYYPPYEIGPYSSGIITFRIPFTEINSIVNQEGSLWQAIQE
ncbi:MAG: WG repeat-containing protein [Cellulosilyticaceae bacterium]